MAYLTRDVMHLFALGPGSDKYEIAMDFQANTHIRAIMYVPLFPPLLS
jgi:hypothetical protein